MLGWVRLNLVPHGDVIAGQCRYVYPVNQIELWLFRVLWLILPFTAGPLFSAALDDTERPFQLGVSLVLWAAWAAMLIASMVPRTQTLTLLRVMAPLAFVAAICASFTVDSATTIGVGVVSAGAATLLGLNGAVGDAFADGSSYGDERRFLLRTPGALMLGPIQLVWLAIAGGAVLGPLLLLAQRWIVGAVALIAGWALVYVAVPVLHRLSERWLVFVPAGLVVHDKTALREPQLFRKETIGAFGPAPQDANVEDLSLGGLGLALRAELTEPTKVIPNKQEHDTDEVSLTEIDGFIVSPNRPGQVLSEAGERGFAIG